MKTVAQELKEFEEYRKRYETSELSVEEKHTFLCGVSSGIALGSHGPQFYDELFAQIAELREKLRKVH